MSKESAVITSKGQMTVPVKVRRAMGLKQGDRLEVAEVGPETVVFRKRANSGAAIVGLLAHLKPDPAYATDDDAIAAEIEARTAPRGVKARSR